MNDVIGYIRPILPRYAAAGQVDAMARNGVQKFVVDGSKHKHGGLVGTRADVLRMMVAGRTLAIQHLFLLGDPKAKRGTARRDLWKAIDEIENRGGVIWELYSGLKTSNPKENAVDDYERGRNEIIDRIVWYAKNAIDHAKSRIKGDGSALDYRQQAMLEAAERLAAWGRALRHKDASAYLYEPVGSKRE